MYIKSVFLDGFKSYGHRTEVTGFDEQFNAITGLNGSGKSDILDSICFVLGITNLSQVRAASLQDLIYKNGQCGIKKATVSIIFDNSNPDQRPPGFKIIPEIVITREIVMDGRNKYMINGSTVPDKRVQNLFCSVQLDVNNPHFLITQGEITKVLNMKPHDILAMIEEAAGTKIYEVERHMAEEGIKMEYEKLNELLKAKANECVQKKNLVDDENTLEKMKAMLEKLKENDQRDAEEFGVFEKKFQALSSGKEINEEGEAETPLEQPMKKIRVLDSTRKAAQNLQSKLRQILGENEEMQDLQGRQRQLQQDLATLQSKIDEFEARNPYTQFRYRDPETNFNRESVFGVVCRLIKVKNDYAATAIETAAGEKLYNVVIDTEVTGEKLLQRGDIQQGTTFISMDKIQSNKMNDNIVQILQNELGEDNVQPALSHISYDDRIRRVMDSIFGNVFICKDINIAKKAVLTTNIRCVTLDGDVANTRAKVSGGAPRKGDSILKQISDIQLCEEQCRIKENELVKVEAEINEMKTKENRYITLQREKKWKKREQDFETYNLEISELIKKTLNTMAQIQIKRIKTIQRVEQQAEISRRIQEDKNTLCRPINEKEYDLKMKEKMFKNNERDTLKFIKDLDRKKEEVLTKAYDQISKDFGSIFSTLLPGAYAKLLLPTGQTILQGLEVKVSLEGVWKESLTELSGGQRSLAALSLILAMQLLKPAPLYILDGVDAALDLSHTQNIGNMLKSHFKKSQFIVVPLKDGMFSNANVLFRTQSVGDFSIVKRTVNRTT